MEEKTYVNVAIDIEGLDKLKNLSEKLSEQVSEISATVQEINHLKLELKINHPKTEDIEVEVLETPSLTDRLSAIETKMSSLEEELKKANSKLNAIGPVNIKLGKFDVENVELKKIRRPTNSELTPGVESLYNTLVMMIRKEIKKSVLTTRDTL